MTESTDLNVLLGNWLVVGIKDLKHGVSITADFDSIHIDLLFGNLGDLLLWASTLWITIWMIVRVTLIIMEFRAMTWAVSNNDSNLG